MHDLLAGVRAALEADADGADDGAQGQRGGKRCGRAIAPDERHAGRLQGAKRDTRLQGPATEPGGVAAPTGEDAALLVRGRVRRRRRGQPPAAHAGGEASRGERRRGDGSYQRSRQALGVHGRAGRGLSVADPVHPEVRL